MRSLVAVKSRRIKAEDAAVGAPTSGAAGVRRAPGARSLRARRAVLRRATAGQPQLRPRSSGSHRLSLRRRWATSDVPSLPISGVMGHEERPFEETRVAVSFGAPVVARSDTAGVLASLRPPGPA
jgi:hypothetical protein